jgi:hypothetical protein
MTIPDEEMIREWDRVRSAMRVSLQTDLPSDQRVGDLVVYCGSVTGVIVGVGQVAGEPRQREADTSGWRIRILPILVMDRHIAPSILAAGSDPPQTPARLDPGRYRRVRDLILSAAVPLDPEAAPSGARSGAGGPDAAPDVIGEGDIPATGAEGGAQDRRIDDEPWAWLTSVSEEQLERDWDRVRAAMAISVDAAILPTMLDVGDLVVYCGSDTGIIAGIGELIQGPREAGAADWRMPVAPRLLLDRVTAPSIDEAGVRPPRLPMRLESEPYSRVRDLILAAAVPLKRRSHA